MLFRSRDAVADAVDHRVAQEARAVGPLRQAAKPDALQEVAQAPATVAARAEPAQPAPEFAANPPASAPAGGGVGGRLAESKPQSAPASADRLEPAPRERLQSADQPSRRNADTLSAGPTPTAAPAPPPAAPQAKSSSASAPAVKLERTVDLTPGKWLERIEELRRSGRLDEAKAEFAEFRKRYPDYRVPESLRDWVKP